VTVALLQGLAGLAGATAGRPAEVAAGDTAADVVARLGKPQGFIEQGRRMIYCYDRGLIDFVDGRVVNSDLLTPYEAERIKRERERIVEESGRQAEEERRRVTEAGEEMLWKILMDEQFAKRAPSERLSVWEEFRKRYPYTDVSNQVVQAEAEIAAERREQERRKEIADLKASVEKIQERFRQLDADYAASLANWKRNEINAERAKLTAELDADQQRLRDLEGQSDTNATARADSNTGR
jgi:hypothetical protein